MPPAGLVYETKTGQGANVDGFSCEDNDGNSPVAFGDLPSDILAVTCTWVLAKAGYDDTVASNIEINKRDARWTASPRSGSCAGMYDPRGAS